MRYRRQVLCRIGDMCPEDHGGGALVRVGPHLFLEYTWGAETEFADTDVDVDTREGRRAEMTVYSVFVPTVGRGLCDVAEIQQELGTYDWEKIARYSGIDPLEVLVIANDPQRAWALYEMVAAYYGWDEMDEMPLSLPYWKVERRWTPRRRRQQAA